MKIKALRGLLYYVNCLQDNIHVLSYNKWNTSMCQRVNMGTSVRILEQAVCNAISKICLINYLSLNYVDSVV